HSSRQHCAQLDANDTYLHQPRLQAHRCTSGQDELSYSPSQVLSRTRLGG
ncbi:uncharacterized protein PgNI_03233, partial [Pyricularia grisea]|uniref:Uncharacterized protein n=1 Tax=Pyricularia grisea TaxID=148305 RepID=A0A6P8B807_PYRGI